MEIILLLYLLKLAIIGITFWRGECKYEEKDSIKIQSRKNIGG
jgi:hypothetical protein